MISACGCAVVLLINLFGFELAREFGQQRCQHLVRHLCRWWLRLAWVGSLESNIPSRTDQH